MELAKTKIKPKEIAIAEKAECNAQVLMDRTEDDGDEGLHMYKLHFYLKSLAGRRRKWSRKASQYPCGMNSRPTMIWSF